MNSYLNTFSSKANAGVNAAVNATAKANAAVLNANTSLNTGSFSLKKWWAGLNKNIVIVSCIVLLLFIAVILYITSALRSNQLKGKAISGDLINLSKSEQAREISGENIPLLAVGNEYTYSFWLYLDKYEREINSATEEPMHKMVFYRGNKDEVITANPVVMLDGKSNKLHFVIKTTESSLVAENGNPLTNLHDIFTMNLFEGTKNINNPTVNKHLILSVDYVPLQRWVHCAIAINNKLVTLYVDGQIYSVTNVDEFKARRSGDYNLIVDSTKGDVFVGKNTVGGMRSPNGYMGKIDFFNYALNSEEMVKVYEKGPLVSQGAVASVMSALGMDNYGFRNPLYKLSDNI